MNRPLILIILLLNLSLSLNAQEPEYNHVFFDNSLMTGGYYYSKADSKSPSYIQSINKKLPVCDKEFFTAKNSLLLNYTSAPDGDWVASVIYQDWRGKEFLKEGTTLDFKILIKSNTSVDELPKVAIAKKEQKKNSSADTEVGYEAIIATNYGAQISESVSLKDYISKINNSNWYQVRIPLSKFKNITYNHTKEIKQVIFAQGNQDGKEHTICIDQIELLPVKISNAFPSQAPAITARAFEKHIDIKWSKDGLNNVKYIKIYRAEKNSNFKPVGIQDPMVGLFADYTGETDKTYTYKITCLDYNYNENQTSNAVSATTYPMSDEELLTMVQEASFRYYWEGAEKNSGLAFENIPGRRNMIATGASGFGMMALITGVDRGFITREQAVERFKKIVAFLDKADSFHGAYAHFIDGSTGKVEPFFGPKDNGADLVETAFMFQGLLTARQYFNKDTQDEKFIRNAITKLWENIEWSWFKKTKDSKYLFWHWSPDQGWVINHKLIGWNETMIVYLLAIAAPKHGVDASMYYTGWASQDQEAINYRSGWGESKDGSTYSNGNTYYGIKLDVGVNTGGPLFFTQFSFMGFDPRGFKDKYTTKDYFETLRNMVRIGYKYCVENPNNHLGYGPGCWGLSAAEDPTGYSAGEAFPKHDNGTVSPAGALGSFPYAPEQAMDALKNYYRNYGSFLWGEYGFRDSFNFNKNWSSSIYMGLNQGAIVSMIENYRTGLLWKTFMQDADMKAGLKKISLQSSNK